MTDHNTAARMAMIGRKRFRISENAKAALAVVALFLAYGIVGRMDYEDALAMEAAAKAQQPQAVQLTSATESTTCGK